MEMAMSRQDAMNHCLSLSKKFIEHFEKIYNNPTAIEVERWEKEMQNWLNEVLSIKLKSNGKPLSMQCKMDWFFTNGSDSLTIFNNDEKKAEKYDDFIDCVCVNNDVKKSIDDVYI